jgi:hypothetical protein
MQRNDPRPSAIADPAKAPAPAPRARPPYEPPRLEKKRSLARTTLTLFTGGGSANGPMLIAQG